MKKPSRKERRTALIKMFRNADLMLGDLDKIVDKLVIDSEDPVRVLERVKEALQVLADISFAAVAPRSGTYYAVLRNMVDNMIREQKPHVQRPKKGE